MALPKQTVNVNFAQGLDTQTDPKQVQVGKFLALTNTVFNKGGLLEKRNGYGQLAELPSDDYSYLSTFNGNLTALGSQLTAYNGPTDSWVQKGALEQMRLSALPVVRSNTNQTYADAAFASNGLVCVVYTDNVPSGGSTVLTYKYTVVDGTTGQVIVAPTTITSSGAVITYAPKVFVLGNYFMILFDGVVGATPHLQYIALNTSDPTLVIAATDISTQYTAASTGSFDAFVANDTLYVAWNGSDGGGAIRVARISSSLVQSSTVAFAGRQGSKFAVTADVSGSTPVIYVAWHDSGDNQIYCLVLSQSLVTITSPTAAVGASASRTNITMTAQDGSALIFFETAGSYSYDAAIATNVVTSRPFTQGGSVGTAVTLKRSAGLASKAVLVNGTAYVMLLYYSANQPTYFLVDDAGTIVSKLAYQNGPSSYYVTGLPNLTLLSDADTLRAPYITKTLVQAANKSQGVAGPNGVYAQTGVNLATFELIPSSAVAAELGANLNISGAITLAYDGSVPVEQGFHLYPDYIEVTTSGAGGLITAQQYYYVVTYEWTDNQGNLFRSAPSLPVSITTVGATSSNTINVPTLRWTAKTTNAVKLVAYRWSTAQQTYYQVTSISIPTLNDVTTDSVAIVDTLADSAIIGNNILYTTGGVLENIGAPATDSLTLFKSRLFGINAEDKNLLNFSKQVIQATPVEMSDLLTLYVSPTIGAQGNTGPMKALGAMDDKLVIFKANAIYYLTGNGPDNTGANNDFSEPTFITSTVGSVNQKSIVFMPNGLMFESDKGIWLLGRDLSTTYIGAPVDDYFESDSGELVLSAVNVPGTNQVRFTLSTGVTLYYDYYFQQWGSFSNVPAVSSCIYNNLHTYITDDGLVYQETPGEYLDGSSPVLISFTTGWFNLAGLQGFQRAYWFYLLGEYFTPHKLSLSIAYDYASTPSQITVITPDNFNETFGEDDGVFGSGSPFGGNSSVEQWRIFFDQQKCQAFQITLTEIYDPSYGVAAGAGFTMSGLALTVSGKKGYPTLPASRSAG